MRRPVTAKLWMTASDIAASDQPIYDGLTHTHTNMGMAGEANIRGKLLAKDTKVGRTEDCFRASTPPLEAKNILFAKTAEKYGRRQRGEEAEY